MAGPKCYVQRKERANLTVHERKFGWKIETVLCLSFLFTFNQAISQTCYLYDFKKNLSQAKPNYVEFSRFLFGEMFHGLFKI